MHRGAGSWLQNLSGRNGTVAALLTSSHDCLATFFGALRSGQTLVSLPHPARGMDGAESVAQIARMCTQTGATSSGMRSEPDGAPFGRRSTSARLR